MAEDGGKRDDGDKRDDDKRDPDAWIETVVKAGRAIGMNPTRLRWKLIRWQESRRRDKRRLEQKIDHIKYEHKTCPECGAVQDRDAVTCTGCGSKLGARGWHVLGRLGVAMPKAVSMSTLLALALLAVYAREMVAMGGGFGTPPDRILTDLGAHAVWLDGEQPWRLLTAVLLHIGIWHIAFNLLALASIGPRIEEVCGRGTMLFLFLVTGVGANFGSDLVANAAGAGASGGIMGLVGFAMGYGHRLRTGGGRGLRDDMIKWAAYTFIFGYAVGADNWAHLFGFLIGAAFGLAVPGWWWLRQALAPVRVLAGVLAGIVLVAGVAIIFTREVRPVPDKDELPSAESYLVLYVVPCHLELTGHHAEGARILGLTSGGTMPDDELSLPAICRSFVEEAKRCETLPKPKPQPCWMVAKVAATFPALEQ